MGGRKRVRRILPAVALAALVVLPPRLTVRAADPDYADIRGHWAYAYIGTLREEEVADGYIHSSGRAYFKPDQPISRAQFAMMLAKAFRLAPFYPPRPTFTDVPVGLTEYRHKEAYGLIEAARQAGIVAGYPDGTFRPYDPLLREQAVAMLIRALGLAPFAASLDEAALKLAFTGFSDAARLDRSLRNEMAAAILLKIIKGYPDRTIRPKNKLTRAEAAAVVCRSCLLRLDASPNPFSPDGDGFEDFTIISVTTLKNRNVVAWNAYITDISGKHMFRRFNNVAGGTGVPPSYITWDGSNQNKVLLPDGTYFYSGWVIDRKAQTHQAVLKPLTLERRTVKGCVVPPVAEPGDVVTIFAYTTAGALSVSAQNEIWPQVALHKDGEAGNTTTWTRQVSVPLTTAEGTYPVGLTALYTGTRRHGVAEFHVIEPISLRGSIIPDTVCDGATVLVVAWTNTNVLAVDVDSPFGGQFSLTPKGPGKWERTCQVPYGTEPGEYDFRLTARTATKRKSVYLTLYVVRNTLQEIQFVLTD